MSETPTKGVGMMDFTVTMNGYIVAVFTCYNKAMNLASKIAYSNSDSDVAVEYLKGAR
ncbi:MAG: hypothetical protein ACYTBJ_26435 [Planctomycetota bacterium]|jgi:hypothetical protein